MSAGKELFKLWGLIGTQGVEKTTSQLKSIDKQVRKTQKQFDRLGRRVANTGKVLTKALTLPLLVVGAAVGKMGADFDQALTASTAIMGELSDVMRKDLKNAAIEVSKVTSFSAKQAAEAYFFLASAGLDAAQSIAALPQVARFAQAGNFELAQATDLLTDAQSALGLSSKDTAENMENMARVSDVLVKANTIANATVAQFSESLTNKAGAALRILGKDVEEGAAVLAVFADQGLKGAASGEALNIVMRDLQRSSLKNEEAFKKANVTVFDSAGEMRNMADIIGDLDGLLLGMSDKQKRATLTMLGFQDKSISSTMALLGASDAIRGYEKDLRGAAGITDEVANKQLKTFWKQLGLLKDRLIAVGLTTDTLAGIGSKILLPVLDFIVTKLETLNNWFNNLSPSMKKTLKGFIVLAVAIGPAVFLVGKLLILAKFLIPVFVALTAGTWSWSGAMAAASMSVLVWVALIGAIIALGWYWYSQWDSISSQLAVIWAQIEMTFMKGANAVLQAFADMIIGVLEGIGKLGGLIPGVSDKIKGATISMLKFKAALYKDMGKQAAVVAGLHDQVKETKSLVEVGKEVKKNIEESLGLKEKDIELTNTQIATNKQKATEEKKAEEDKKAAAQERADFDKQIQDQINEMTLSKMELLEIEKEETIRIADEKGASVFEVVALYALKEQELKDKIREEEKRKDEAKIKNGFNMASKLGGKLNNVLAKFSQNKLKRLDISEKKEIAAINASTMSEEQKQAAIQKVQEKTDTKRRKLQREAAIRDKIFALFQIGINTAQEITKVLATPWLIPIVAGLGAAEAVAVASAPIPLYEGGFIRGSEGGVNTIVGEQQQDEIVFPLERGLDMMIDGLLGRMGDIENTAGARPAADDRELTPVGAGVTLNIGTLIGDDRSLKELERRLDTVRIAENQRKGFA